MPAWIGTSGWSYKHWKGVFYPPEVKADQWLEYYATHFGSVEINSSFYYLPRESTFDGWRERTPEDFVFAVKASRYITHIQRMSNTIESLRRLFGAAFHLEDKLGVVLFQLPPSMKRDTERLRRFLEDARDRAGTTVRMAFEFRDVSWLDDSTYSVLSDHNAALVFADWGPVRPMGPVTADFVYLRRHGPEGDGRRAYPRRYVKADGDAIKEWLSGGIDAFAYYNNDYAGSAVKNARELSRYVGGTS